jgi:5-amino-6-(5-phospho-D-ribitylamino)uracil phosphatase
MRLNEPGLVNTPTSDGPAGDGVARRSAVRLIATDLDGTLLNSEGIVPEANRRALQRAVGRGVHLALVTARRASSTRTIADLLGLPCARIIHNGARTWDWSGVELGHYRIPLGLAEEIAQYADRHDIGLIMTIDEVNYYGGGSRVVWRDNEDKVTRTNVEALVAPPTRIIVAGAEAIDRLWGRFGNAPDSIVVHRYYSRVGAIESAVITHPRATKENALAELCERYSINPDEVMALGDAEADAGMLRWAGVGVAMANGMPEAHAAATWIAPSHDEAGVAAAVERFVDDGSESLD